METLNQIDPEVVAFFVSDVIIPGTAFGLFIGSIVNLTSYAITKALSLFGIKKY